jgi:hypothetical protein
VGAQGQTFGEHPFLRFFPVAASLAQKASKNLTRRARRRESHEGHKVMRLALEYRIAASFLFIGYTKSLYSKKFNT